MTKDLLMKYTFVALCVLTGVSFFSWGIDSLILASISVVVAVGTDILISKVAMKGQLNTMSAAVFGLIVALSYSLGIPSSLFREQLPLMAPISYAYSAIISLVGMVFFKKLQGLSGRKYVNPAATAKLIVFIPSFYELLRPVEHAQILPPLTISIGYSGSFSFGSFLHACFANAPFHDSNAQEVLVTLTVLKHHGWIGGASSIAVIAVGIALFALCRRYIKWRITTVYLVTVALFALALNFVYGGDPILRMAFHLFAGSSLFLAFFMATDPSTTPLTYAGQAVLGGGFGVLS